MKKKALLYYFLFLSYEIFINKKSVALFLIFKNYLVIIKILKKIEKTILENKISTTIILYYILNDYLYKDECINNDWNIERIYYFYNFILNKINQVVNYII